MDAVFLHDWESLEDMIGDFAGIYMTGKEYHAAEAPYANKESWEKRKAKMASELASGNFSGVLLASYTYEDYSGDAFVLLEREGRLYEVNGGHCSCYGLEDQWDPKEVTIGELRHRMTEGQLGRKWSYFGKLGANVFAEELAAVLDKWEAK